MIGWHRHCRVRISAFGIAGHRHMTDGIQRRTPENNDLVLRPDREGPHFQERGSCPDT